MPIDMDADTQRLRDIIAEGQLPHANAWGLRTIV